MGTFSVGCKIANHIDRTRAARIPRVLVDAGSESTWIAESTLEKLGVEREKKDLEFIMADGMRITRAVGFALVYVEKTFTIDEVVFAEKGDRVPLGARSLKGLNLAVDSWKKKLVAAGPLPVASSCDASSQKVPAAPPPHSGPAARRRRHHLRRGVAATAARRERTSKSSILIP